MLFLVFPLWDDPDNSDEQCWALLSMKFNRQGWFLDAARGMSGVCQVIHGGDGALVSTLRGITIPEYQRPFFADRWFSRLVLKHYGLCNISRFKGHKDLLCGFRDAIAGHQRLWNTGILHGDVNMENILLTSQHAPPGGRGILINLDLAMWLEGRVDNSALNLNFHNQGTRAYMSLNVLESQHTPRASFSRDHLDDLESFYYLLRHICATFTGPGEQLPKPDFIKAWEQPDTAAAAAAKMGSLLCADAEPPTAYFGPTFAALLEKLRAFIANAVGCKRDRDRENLCREWYRAPVPTTWRALRAAAAVDYCDGWPFIQSHVAGT
ncbi:hypothetical protein BJ912DRAFT_1038081 [Pholiota molesta]|nr:hypothetical protein BJ912DRAFT_1038081 [Pholiota molesta]